LPAGALPLHGPPLRLMAGRLAIELV